MTEICISTTNTVLYVLHLQNIQNTPLQVQTTLRTTTAPTLMQIYTSKTLHTHHVSYRYSPMP